MLRFISHLFRLNYEPCHSCETLKEQLLFERDERKRLTDMLLEIMKPKVEVVPNTIVMEPLNPPMTTFSRRRAALEERDRIEAATKAQSKIKAEPDNINIPINKNEAKVINRMTSVEQLEKELGVEDDLGGIGV